MAEFVDRAVNDIDTRLRELKEEVSRLQAARSALIGPSRRGPGRPRGAGTGSATRKRSGRRPGRPRGRRSSTRAAQALQIVRDRPGVTIPQIAESMKIEPNYLYRVMPKLVSNGEIRREGSGWYPAGAQAG